MVSENNRPSFVRREVQVRYLIYYSATTGVAVSKCTQETDCGMPHIEVSRETYQEIDMCDKFRVIEGKLQRIIKSEFKRLQLNPHGKFAAIKDNMLFVADKSYTGDIENWEHING